MKKFSMGKRIMSLLLAVVLVMSAVPTSVWAATTEDFSTTGNTGLTGNIDTSDSISWPIKIYDYLNDGMLFEYSSAQSTSQYDNDTAKTGFKRNSVYGGGELMPSQSIVGNDYTINGGYSVYVYSTTGRPYQNVELSSVYSEQAYTAWLPLSLFKTDGANAGYGNPGAFKHLHLQLKQDVTNARPLIVSDFLKDNSGAIAKGTVQYVALVYRTNVSNATVNIGMSTEDIGEFTYAGGVTTSWKNSGYTSLDYDYRGTISVTSDEKWHSVVIDLGQSPKWANYTSIYAMLLDIGNMTTTTQYFDVSHIAYFDTKMEADIYAADAAAFSSDPGEYLPDQKETIVPEGAGGPVTYTTATLPVTSANAVNFTNGSGFSNAAYTSWTNKTKGGSGAWQYARIGYKTPGDPSYYQDAYFFNNSTIVNKSSVRYVTIVYRTNGWTADSKLGFWIRDTVNNKYAAMLNSGIYTTFVTLPKSEDKWVSITYDLDWIKLRGDDSASAYNAVPYVNQICALYAMSSGQTMDIAYIDFDSSLADAHAFAEDAVNYMNEVTETKTKPTTNSEMALDFVNSTAISTNMVSLWEGSNYGLVVEEITATNEHYVNVSDTGTGRDVMGLFRKFDISGVNSQTDIDGIPKTEARFITIVYRTHNLTANSTIAINGIVSAEGKDSGVYFNRTESWSAITSGEVVLPQSENEWVSLVYDLNDLNNATYNSSSYPNVTFLYMALPGFENSSQSMDIAYIDFYSNENAAKTFGTNAAAYMNRGTGTASVTITPQVTTTNYYKHWNMGGNSAFTMLLPSDGGGWNSTTYGRGGNNKWANGYFSYAIGHTIAGSDWTYWNPDRDTAKGLGYVVSDTIFTLDDHSNYDTSSFSLGYTLYNTAVSGPYTIGLLESGLKTVTKGNKTYKILQYKNDTIDYIAQLLENTLLIPQTDMYGNYNYSYVQGSKSDQFAYTYNADTDTVTAGVTVKGVTKTKVDLATALRTRLGIVFQSDKDKGTTTTPRSTAAALDADKRNALIGDFDEVLPEIDSFAAAAYYLLHNLFVDNSYNQVQDEYNYLVLSKGTLSETGKEAYVFDAGFTTGAQNYHYDTTKGYYVDANGNQVDAATIKEYMENSDTGVRYDPLKKADGTSGSGTISLIGATTKDEIYYLGTYDTTRFPFLPVTAATGDYAGQSGTYFDEDEATSTTPEGATYANRNYNYVMQANGEFVYHYEDDLFFNFEGDDDVYLFVNGELVLDIGAAHSITRVDFSMNKYVEKAQEELKNLSGYYAGISDEDFENLLKNVTDATQKAAYRRWHKLNLIDGQSYAIDFYYMERHGWGANMRIATNIVMTDPAMKTTKAAYQDGGEIPYGGIVDNTQLIEYSFSVTNNGNNKLYNLTFTDNDIGVKLDKNGGLTIANGSRVQDKNGGTLEPEDLVVTVSGYGGPDNTNPVYVEIKFEDVTDADGTVTETAEQQLKKFLTNLSSDDGTDSSTATGLYAGSGLWKDGTVTIRGIYYKLPTTLTNNKFDNKLSTTANPSPTSTTVINGEDTHQVRVNEDAIHIYQWAGHKLYISRAELVRLKTGGFVGGGKTYTADEIKFETTQFSGTAFSYPNVTVENAEGLYIEYPTVGTRTIYLKVSPITATDINGDEAIDSNDYLGVIPLIIHVADVEDDVIVLDYGLQAELTGANGIKANDYLTFTNTKCTVMSMTADSSVGYLAYSGTWADHENKNINRINFPVKNGTSLSTGDGTFTVTANTDADDQLTFTPDQFMDQLSTMYVAVTVHEKNTTPSAVGPKNGTTVTATVDISKEVQMYQKVTVLPANVVYYEDDFPAIEYITEEGTSLSSTNVFNQVKNSGNISQSVAQDTPYGSDPTYQTNSNTTQSGGSLTTITIKDSNTFARFTFKGTGFEIISRTAAVNSGTMVVTVKDSAGTVLKRIPVVTEFDNVDNGTGGDEVIYQVPVIRVDDLTLGNYTVEISGTPLREETSNSALTLNDISAACNTDPNGYIPDSYLTTWKESGKITTAQYNALVALSGLQRVSKALEITRPATIDTYLYIDGIRIFKPMGATNENYSDAENGATFVELRDLILNSQVALVSYNQTNKTISTGTSTWTEDRNGTALAGTIYTNRVSSLEDYLTQGPNNEVYVRWTSNSSAADMKQALVFYVAEDSAVADKSLQVGFRYVNGKEFDPTNNTLAGAQDYCKLCYGTTTSSGSMGYLGLVSSNNIVSSTEQYYTIDYTNCPTVTFGDDNTTYYEVVLVATTQIGCFTSLKYKGLTLKTDNQYKGDEVLEWKYENGQLVLINQATGQAEETTGYSMRYRYLFDLMETDLSEDTEETVVQPTLELVSPSLSFEDEIKYNVYFTAENIDDVVEMGLITFDERLEDGTIENATTVIPSYVEVNGQYMAGTNGIAAKDLAKAVYFKAYAKLSDGSYVYSGVEGYHAVAYAKDILANSDNEQMKALVVAMLNYGAAAQKYFDSAIADAELMNSFLTAEQQAMVSGYTVGMVADLTAVDSAKVGQFAGVSGGYTAMAPNVAFEGAFAINFYFTPAKVMDGDLTLYYWTADAYAAAEELTADNASGKVVMEAADGKYVGAVSGIAAKQIDQTVFVAGVYESDGVEYSTGVIAYSLGAYCVDRIANGTGTMQAFASATAVYGYYAKNYFA